MIWTLMKLFILPFLIVFSKYHLISPFSVKFLQSQNDECCCQKQKKEKWLTMPFSLFFLSIHLILPFYKTQAIKKWQMISILEKKLQFFEKSKYISGVATSFISGCCRKWWRHHWRFKTCPTSKQYWQGIIYHI